MSEVYDTGLWNNVLLAAKKEGMDLACGTYLMYSGPSYEPPAEIRFFDKIGADAVGTSTVLEAIIARHCDIQSFPGEGIVGGPGEKEAGLGLLIVYVLLGSA